MLDSFCFECVNLNHLAPACKTILITVNMQVNLLYASDSLICSLANSEGGLIVYAYSAKPL